MTNKAVFRKKIGDAVDAIIDGEQAFVGDEFYVKFHPNNQVFNLEEVYPGVAALVQKGIGDDGLPVIIRLICRQDDLSRKQFEI